MGAYGKSMTVRAILRYVNDKPEPTDPSFFTEADQAGFDETRRSS